MKIRVEYTAHLKRAAGTDGEEVELSEEATLTELIESLSALHGDQFSRHMFDREGNLHPAAVVVVNGEQVYLESPRRLSDGDTVLFLAAIAGG